MFKSILVTTDGSELANKAVHAAIGFAKEYGSRIVGVCVEEIYPYFPLSTLEGIENISTYADAIHEEGKANLKKISELADIAGVPCEVHLLKGSAPHEEIIKAAERFHCDSIFMASHGRKGLDKILLGSQTQKVLVNSKLPVMVFK